MSFGFDAARKEVTGGQRTYSSDAPSAFRVQTCFHIRKIYLEKTKYGVSAGKFYSLFVILLLSSLPSKM